MLKQHFEVLEIAKQLDNNFKYTISFDIIPNVAGKQPFSSIVLGKSSTGDVWSHRLFHHNFTVIKNSDGSSHYKADFTIDKAKEQQFGLVQRFIAETYDGTVGGVINNLKVAPSDNVIVANSLTPLLGRGYTGHEHLPWFGLINMNCTSV